MIPGALLDPTAYALSLYSVPTAAAGAASILLGVRVAWRERGSRESVTFLILTLFIATWLLTSSLMHCARRQDLALWWTRATYLAIPGIAPAAYQFAAVLLRVQERRRPLLWAGWLGAGLFTLVALATDDLIAGLREYSWGFYARYGWLGLSFLLFFFTFLGLALHEYQARYREADTEARRNRIKWLLVAYVVGYVASVDFLPAFGVGLYPFGYVPIFLFLAVAGWTIRRYRLVDLTPAFAADEIVTTMDDPVIVCDLARCIRFVNPATCATLGYAVDELLGKPIETIIHPGAGGAGRLLALLQGDRLRSEEMVLKDRGGGPVEVLLSASRLHDHEGVEVGTLVIARDIRERKDAARALHASEERFRLLVDGVVDYAIFLLDPAGHVVSWNEGAQRIAGYTEEEILGQHFSVFFPGQDVQRARPQRELRMAAEKGRYEGVGWRVRKDGKKFWANVIITALRDDVGRLIGFAKVTRDLTQQKELEEQLRQSQKMEAVGRLAGGVAHDFNNLLTVINGHTQLLMGEAPDDDPTYEELETIKRAADRAAGLTRQLLAFSRRQVLEPEVVSLNDIAADMEKMLRRVIGEDVQLVTVLDPDIGHVEVDVGQIEQVILNLAVNARDAMPRGGTLTIETANTMLGADDSEPIDNDGPSSHVMLAVTDTGVGMDHTVKERIFEPFFTTKDPDRGTGLGLSTVYGIVKQSGGEIRVYSEPGQGTTFELYFPRVNQAPQDTLETEEASLPHGNGETILLVEDDPDVLNLTATTLRRAGYSVLEARTVEQARRLCRLHPGPIHLLLTDIVLRTSSGYDLARELSGARSETRTLYMSGYTPDSRGERERTHSEAPLLQKPFRPRDLVLQVRERLNGDS